MPAGNVRKLLLALIVMSGCTCCTGVEPPDETSASGELVYVTNEDSGDLSVIDSAANEVVATIPIGKRPRGVRVSADGRTIFVAVSGSPKCPPWMSDEDCEAQTTDKSLDGIAVVDAVERVVTHVLPGGSDPEQFDISGDGKRLCIANEDAGLATIVELDSREIVATVEVGEEPEGVRTSPDGQYFYVTGETDHNITVIDAEQGERVAQITVGHRPRDTVFTSNSARAYVSSEIDGTVSIIDVPNHKVIETVALPKNSRSMGLALSPDDKLLYVANGRSKTVSIIDLGTNEVIATFEVGDRPWGIGVSSDGKRLYTANGPSDDVSVVDTESHEVVAKIAVGETPWGIAIAPPP